MVLSSELLASILEEVRPLLGQGKVADYIPALAQVPADRLGIAVCTVEGELFTAGDAFEPFSIQSISKALSLTLALTLYQEEEIWARVGKEPSGQPFNSLIQLEFEHGIPRNPFINAGALVVSDLLETRLTAPGSVPWNWCGACAAIRPSWRTRWWPAPNISTPPATPPSPT